MNSQKEMNGYDILTQSLDDLEKELSSEMNNTKKGELKNQINNIQKQLKEYEINVFNPRPKIGGKRKTRKRKTKKRKTRKTRRYR